MQYPCKRLILEGINPKKLHEDIRGSIGPLPSTFDTIHPIDLIFAHIMSVLCTFKKMETMSCLMGFHGSHNYINDVTGGRHLGFLIFHNFF